VQPVAHLDADAGRDEVLNPLSLGQQAEGTVVAAVEHLALADDLLRTDLGGALVEEDQVGFAADGRAGVRQRVADDADGALGRVHDEAHTAAGVARRVEDAGAWLDLEAFRNRLDHALGQRRLDVAHGGPVAAAARIFDLGGVNVDGGVREEVEVLHVVPVQVSEHEGVDLLGRHAEGAQAVHDPGAAAVDGRIYDGGEAEARLVAANGEAGDDEVHARHGCLLAGASRRQGSRLPRSVARYGRAIQASDRPAHQKGAG